MASAASCAWSCCRPNVISSRPGAPSTYWAPYVSLPSEQWKASVEDWRGQMQQRGRLAVLLPLAACTVFVSGVNPAEADAGLLSGIKGLESFNLPAIPTPSDIVKRMQEANSKKYRDLDDNFKSSQLVQDLLKKSKENAELHKKEIQTKYCAREAEWGVGDCSLAGSTQAEKDAFFKALGKSE